MTLSPTLGFIIQQGIDGQAYVWDGETGPLIATYPSPTEAYEALKAGAELAHRPFNKQEQP